MRPGRHFDQQHPTDGPRPGHDPGPLVGVVDDQRAGLHSDPQTPDVRQAAPALSLGAQLRIGAVRRSDHGPTVKRSRN